MPKKNGSRANNGMGSIRQRPDGRWEARYTAPDGRQHSLYAKTEKAVTARLRASLHDVDMGAWKEPSKMTVAEWMEIWLADYQGHNSVRTVEKYRCIVNAHFIPLLGDVKLVKLSPLHIRRLVTSLSKLQPVTIKNYVRIFSAALSCAIEAGIISTNPADKVKLPRPAPTQLHIIDREDIPRFLDAINATDYPHELALMLYTGLRVGELRGLRWADIDLEAKTIHVQRQLHPINHDRPRITPPKYGEDRLLHIPDEAVAILRDQRKHQAEQRLAAGGWDFDDVSKDLVFRLPNGHPHNDRTIYNAVKAVGRAIGQPDLHPHDLRHSYAVAALRSGADVKTVQHNLGHKTAKMTLDVYAAYTEDAGKTSASMFSEYLKNAQK